MKSIRLTQPSGIHWNSKVKKMTILAVLLLAACGKPENARRMTQKQAVELALDAAEDAFNSLSA
jgi:uncharacterized lipoprotein YajG